MLKQLVSSHPWRFPVIPPLVSLIFLLGFLLPSQVCSQFLTINPSVSIPNDTRFTVQVMTECLGSQVKGLETVITFDHALVQLDSITPGPWFTGAPGEYFFWDFTSPGTGVIHFAGSLLDGTSDANGVLATCHFSALGFGQTPLVFQVVDVRDLQNANLGFDHSVGDLIILDAAINTRDQSFGALKAIYR